MPSSYTPNYQLSQWEPGDQVLREDFNADNAKIDAALAAKADIAAMNAALAQKPDADALPHLVYGSYTGNGEWTLNLELGVPAKLLFISCVRGGSQQLFLFREGTIGQPIIENHRKIVWGETSISLEPYYTGNYPDGITEMNNYNSNYRWLAVY